MNLNILEKKLVGAWSPTKKHPGARNFLLGLVDHSWNRLASTAYFAIISSIILGGLLSESFCLGGFCPGAFFSGAFDQLPIKYVWSVSWIPVPGPI